MPGGRIDILVGPDLSDFPGRLAVGLRQQIPLASGLAKGIGLAIAGGLTLATIGFGAVIDKGIEFRSNLNELKSVSSATSVQMVAVGRTAQALGADLTLPATSSADAAAAMLELSKGGLSVQESMEAAKGTLQLSAAAHIEAARAAEIQSSTLNQFRLSADQAGRVADVLANTANAASGEITDMALSLKYVGSIAQALNVPLEDTAATIGLLANNGIIGETAGTALRGMLASLAAPSAAAKKGIRELGLEVFDQNGRFVGMRSVIEQLASAQGRMTDQQFAANAEIAFGREPLAAITALAAEGGPAFDEMAKAVARTGGAADVAAAKTKGLGGALEGFKSTAETVGLSLFDVIEGPLEGLVKRATEVVSEVGPAVTRGLQTGVNAARLFGPDIAAAMRDRGDALADAVEDLLEPLGPGLIGLFNTGVNAALNFSRQVTGGLRTVASAARPVAEGIGEILDRADEAGGPVDALATGLDLVGDAGGELLRVLVPVGRIVGNLAETVADLPGPVQTAVLGMLAFRAVRGPLDDVTGSSGRLRTTLRQIQDEMRLQETLAPAELSLTRFGAAMAATERHVPTIGRMAEAYRDAAGGAERFGKAAGTAAAGGSLLRSAGGGLVSLMGGPLGLAIGGVTLGLGLLSAAQEKNRESARRSAEAQRSYADALRDTNGAITDSVREIAQQRIATEKLTDTGRQFGITAADMVDAILGQGDAFDRINTQLDDVIGLADQYGQSELGGQLSQQQIDAGKLQEALARLAGEYGKGRSEADRLAEAMSQSGRSMLSTTDTGRSLADAFHTLADTEADADQKGRALKDALDALAGGQVNYEQSIADLNETTGQLGDAFKEAAKQAKDVGAGLLDAAGGFNTSTDAGRRLLDLTDDLGTQMATAAQTTFEYARANGDDVPTALLKARDAAQKARDAFLKGADAAGIGADQAQILADRYGLIPADVVTLIQQPGMTKAQIELLLLKQRVDEVPNGKTITVRSLSDEAKQKLVDLGFTVRTLPDGRVQVTANTQPARDNLAAFLAAPATKVVQVVYRGVESFRTAAGTLYQAQGGLLAAAYAGGGMRKLNPMRAGYAQIVPPNTWRIIGDRLTHDELYLPLDPSRQRNHDLLALANERMGWRAVRMFADGAIASLQRSTGASSTVTPPLTVNNTIVAAEQPPAAIARAVVDDIDWARRTRWTG